ncbi:MAG: oligosaccharide flippase family protein, partial [Dehalococcoidales bacterium]
MEIIAGLSCHGAVGLAYFNLPKAELSSYVGTTFILVVACFGILFPLVTIFHDLVGRLTGLSSIWLLFTPLVGLANVITLTNMSLWQVKQKAIPYGLYNIFQSLLNLGLSIYLVVYLKLGWQGRLTSVIATAGIFAIISFSILMRSNYLKWSWNTSYAKDMLRFGLPLIPHQAAYWVRFSLDRVVLVSLIGLESVGIYAVAVTLSRAINIIVVSFATAWSPHVYSVLSLQNAGSRERLVRLSYLYIISLSLIAVVYSLSAPYILSWAIGHRFQEVFKYLPFFIAAEVLDGCYRIFAVYIYYSKRNEFVSMVTTISGIFHFCLLFILVKQYGMTGAAIALICSSLLNFILIVVVSHKIHPMPWNILSKSAKAT